ncbi:MAG TPA: F0F1 ATP synthase subunit B [Pseudonocardia sp.]|jgi:ATP synthase F0 subunit b|nr:F0F1 ATP synthase subunit B [Pseudonocardia sp.]
MEEILHFAAELVAFLLVAFLVFKFVWPALSKMMNERQDAVQRQVEEAEEAARNLEAAQLRFDQAVAEARFEAARIRDDARADAAQIREELREQAEREVERIKQRGAEELAAQRDQIVRQLRAEIGALSFDTAERLVTDALGDKGRQSSTVDRFLGELDQMGGAASQQGTRSQATAELGGRN